MAVKNSVAADSTPVKHVSIDRVINAPRALVFKTWTEPQHLLKWCHLGALKTIKTDVDVRPNGHWNIDLQFPDGTGVSVRRVYREIVEPERIVFYEKCTAGSNVMLDGTHTVVFEDLGDKTRITVTCDLVNSFDSENQQGWSGGWSELFDHLSAHLAHMTGT